MANSAFQDISYAPLLITAATDIVVLGNTFTNVACQPTSAAFSWSQSWFLVGAPVQLWSVDRCSFI